jgi:hypothetical protein
VAARDSSIHQRVVLDCCAHLPNPEPRAFAGYRRSWIDPGQEVEGVSFFLPVSPVPFVQPYAYEADRLVSISVVQTKSRKFVYYTVFGEAGTRHHEAKSIWTVSFGAKARVGVA